MRVAVVHEERDLYDGQIRHGCASLELNILEVIEQYKRDPDEIHFASAACATDTPGGTLQIIRNTALLVWRDN